MGNMDRNESGNAEVSKNDGVVARLRKTLVSALKRTPVGRAVWRMLIRIPAVRNLTNKMDFGDRFDGAKAYFQNNRELIERTERALADSLSVSTYRAVRMAMETLDRKYLKQFKQPGRCQYFDPSVPLAREAYTYFADCGAYTGDTLKQMFAWGGGCVYVFCSCDLRI